jgi:PKHD-type hydroxylase
MFISTLDGLISAKTLALIQELLRGASFVDGHISGGDDTNKNNLELPPGDSAYLELLKVVEAEVRGNLEFNFTAYPRYMTRPIFSRYDPGMYYHEHVDFPVMNFLNVHVKPGHRGAAPVGMNYVRSDLSLTVFLSAPESYDGGQLTFSGTLEKVQAKLNAGSGVLYPTGSEHRVEKVTRGSRLAAIFWIQSMFPVEAHRKAVYDAYTLCNSLKSDGVRPESIRLAEQVFYNSFRMLAQI